MLTIIACLGFIILSLSFIFFLLSENNLQHHVFLGRNAGGDAGRGFLIPFPLWPGHLPKTGLDDNHGDQGVEKRAFASCMHWEGVKWAQQGTAWEVWWRGRVR